MESMSNKKRVRSDSEHTELDSPEAKRIQLDLFDTVDDDDELTSGQDLDSFIKSFEDEISPPSESVLLSSDSGESKPDLEFLLEASDDELGLPPTEVTPVDRGVHSWLDDQENYGSFEYGFNYTDDEVNSNGEYVALDGLFNYTDLDFGSADLSRRPES